MLAAVDDSNLLDVLNALVEILRYLGDFINDERLAQLCLEVVSRINDHCARFFHQNVPVGQDWVYYLGQRFDRLRNWNHWKSSCCAVDFTGLLISDNTCTPLDSKLKQLFRPSLLNQGPDLPSIYKPCLYLAYLFLCACAPRDPIIYKPSQVLGTIPVVDVQPDMIFYLPTNRPLQVTPWIAFLCNWERYFEEGNCDDTLIDVLKKFLEGGASLGDKTLFQLSLSDQSFSGYCTSPSTANIFECEAEYIIYEVNLAHILCQIRQRYYLHYGAAFDIKESHSSTSGWVRPILVKLQAWAKSNAVEITDEQESLHLSSKFRKVRLAMLERSLFSTTMPRYSADEEREEFAIPETDARVKKSTEVVVIEFIECIEDLKQRIQEISEREDARFVDPELFLKQRGYLKDKDDPMVLEQHQEIIRAGREYMAAFKASEAGKDWALADEKARMNED